jgi:integrase
VQGLFYKEPKNKTSQRAVAISPEVVNVLKGHMKEQIKHKMALGEAFKDNDLICCLQDGSPINPSTVTKRFQEVAKEVGYKVTFHQLRHAHASFLLKQGIHPKVVSERLGHSNISMTMDLYSHIAPTLQRDAANN